MFAGMPCPRRGRLSGCGADDLVAFELGEGTNGTIFTAVDVPRVVVIEPSAPWVLVTFEDALGARRADRDDHQAAGLELPGSGGGSMPQVTMILSNGAASSPAVVAVGRLV